jgi:hypothetical protein
VVDKLSLLDFSIFDVHLTTLLTYLGTFIILVLVARRRNYDHRNLFLFVIGLMIASVLSFETIWLPLHSIFTHSRFLGVSSLIIDLTIIIFALEAVPAKRLVFNSIFLALLLTTIILWTSWLPTFAADSASRMFADPIKIFQTATMIYPFIEEEVSKP